MKSLELWETIETTTDSYDVSKSMTNAMYTLQACSLRPATTTTTHTLTHALVSMLLLLLLLLTPKNCERAKLYFTSFIECCLLPLLRGPSLSIYDSAS